ncbi:DUF6159 family protein [Halobacterium jilantaiense]|uniref:Membrane domain of glycerophosphoryl diester phosphodiesterase n=1 Tax=Halobacterium jilantaiense TaxID=355548 RepID=A0A1I0QE59_9EURY|nr:DUF6159 family protein [Halobacterium jilantaiense]SEW24894.1 hypothetical protein SAMN04487945_2493 [Halobacterium jilantaiense]
MGLRSRLWTGIALARDSVDLLRDNPGLLWFPAAAGVAGVAFALLAFGGAVGLLPLAALADASEVALYGGLAVGYFGASFVVVLFTAGLMFAAREVMAGREPSVRGGLAAAWEHKSTLFAWAVVSTVVGLVVRAIQESDNLGAVLAGALLSASWAVVTYFVVPVAVFEDEGIRGVFGRSVDVVRDTWGESIGAEFGLGFVHGILFLGVVAVAAVVFLATGSPLAAAAVGLPLVALAFVVASTLNGVAKVALYEYATTGEPPQYFENVDFDVGGDGDAGRTTSLGRFGGDRNDRI